MFLRTLLLALNQIQRQWTLWSSHGKGLFWKLFAVIRNYRHDERLTIFLLHDFEHGSLNLYVRRFRCCYDSGRNHSFDSSQDYFFDSSAMILRHVLALVNSGRAHKIATCRQQKKLHRTVNQAKRSNVTSSCPTWCLLTPWFLIKTPFVILTMIPQPPPFAQWTWVNDDILHFFVWFWMVKRGKNIL